MERRDPSSPTPMPTILRYGIAVLSVAIAIGLDFFLLRQFEAILTPFLFAVATTVWYAGTGPGVLAIVLSVLSLNFFFLRPGFSFSPISSADLVYLTFCIFCALAVGWVSAVRRRTEQELRQVRDELEAKVSERTANLQRSESYLAETQKLTHTGSWAWDARSQKVLYCSEEMFRIYGLDPQVDLPTRKNFRQRVHPEDRNRTDERFVRVVNEKVDSFDEYRVLLPDGTVKHVVSSGHPVLDGNGEFIAFIGTATDVTERKRAEEALREREAKIRRLVDSNIIGIFITGLEGRVLEANDAFLHLVGHDRDDLVSGRVRWTDLTPPEWRERDRRALAELSSNTIAQPYEKEFFQKDGSRVPVLIGGALFEEGGNEGVAFVLDLTERKRAEEALVRSEAYLAETQKLTHTGTWAWDVRSQKVLFCSEEMFRIYGLDPQVDLPTRRNFRQRVHPEDRNRVDERQARVVNEKAGSFDEFRIVLPDGTVKHVSSSWHTVLDGNGELIELIGTATDITERKRGEEALRESERSARSALDGIAGLVAIMTPNGEVETVNRQCVEYFGRPVEEQKDWVTTDMVHPEDLPQMLENFQRAIASEISYHFEQRLRRFDGKYRWFETRGGSVRDDTGSIVRWYVLLTDIEDRKHAEDALRESEAKFRDYAESASDWYWETDPDHKFTHLTEDERRLARGVAAVSRIGVARWEFATDVQSEPEKWELHRSMLKARQPFRDFVYQATHGDGSVVYNKISGKPVFDAKGEFRGYRGTGTDVTALRTVEAQARESERRYREAQLELAHANRVATMGQLTASITHEVNQPITAAVTYALAARRFLSVKPPNLDEVDDVLSLIVKEGNRAGEVVGRVRALIKKAPARKDAVEINDAILEVIALTRTEAANNRVLVRTQLAEGLPRVQGDRVQLQQVLLNLVINAIEAMRDVDEEERELLISTRHEPDGVSVEVRDSGPGFAAADLDRVFEAFYSTKPSGVGLGLSICRSIIEAHNGRLWASPNVPRGAVFGFVAPAHPAAGQPAGGR
jgi:PAS domain S-box-containing protein